MCTHKPLFVRVLALEDNPVPGTYYPNLNQWLPLPIFSGCPWGRGRDLPCLLSPVYSTAVGLEIGDVSPEEHHGGISTAPRGLVPWVTASLQTHGWFARLLQSQVLTGFHCLSQLVRLLDIASTMLCMVVHIYLRAPVLSLTLLRMMKEEFLPDTVTIQNTISIALIIFLFLWKEAISALTSASMQLFNGFIPL